MTYRAPNRRIQQRATSGRFRETTLADVGLAHCPACGGRIVMVKQNQAAEAKS